MPVISAQKTTLRKLEPSVTGAWHQDGSFLTDDIPILTRSEGPGMGPAVLQKGALPWACWRRSKPPT
jgi:hypothetical protein